MVKKVLLITIHGDPLAPLGSSQAGGQNNYVKQLMYSLSQKGLKVDVVTHWSNPENPATEFIHSNIRVIRIAAERLKFVPKNNMYDLLVDFYPELQRRIDLNSYDILHTNYWLSGILGHVIKKDFNLPWAHTSHSLGMVKAEETGEINKLRVKAENVIFNNADTIIATTNNEKQVILDQYHVGTNIEVIPIGVDDMFFIPQKKNAIKEKYFLYVGRLERTKGVETLIEAFNMMQQTTMNETKLVIVGGGSKITGEFSLPATVKRKIRGIEEKVIFTGGLPQEKLVRIFANAIATIVPSHYESFGMVAAESQTTGVPVLASNVGGLQEVVQHEVTGYLFEKQDVKYLSTLMLKLYENDYACHKLGKQAKEFANSNFNWGKITNQIISLYKELTHENEAALYISNRS